MKNYIKNQALKASIIILSLSQIVGCSTKSDNQAVVPTVYDLTGVYRSITPNGDVKSLTSLEVFKGDTENDANVKIFKSGLSSKEFGLFNDLNLVEWADARLGREVSFSNLKSGSDNKNTLKDEQANLELCDKEFSHADTSMDFLYCLNLTRDVESLEAQVELTLYAYKLGELVREVKTSYIVFIKDRWAVDYFGNWEGEVSFNRGNIRNLSFETGQSLFLTFQPVTEGEYILRPYDSNQTIFLGSEEFVLYPENKQISELEENANPYVNFRYLSAQNGAREIVFNSFVRVSNQIEGNIILKEENGSEELLGLYNLDKISE